MDLFRALTLIYVEVSRLDWWFLSDVSNKDGEPQRMWADVGRAAERR